MSHATGPVDVLIVGAGPVGLLLAVALTELGVRVRIFERGASTKHDPRAAIVWPRAAEVLASLGLGARFEASALRLRRAKFHINGRPAGVMELGRIASAHPQPLMIEQHMTERLLAERLSELGVAIEWNTEVTKVDARNDGVTVHIRCPTGETHSAEGAWVVGCEGSRSLIRTRMGARFDGAPREDLICTQMNAVPRWSLPDDRETGYFFIVPRTSLLACPLPTGGYRFVCFTTRDAWTDAAPRLEDMRALVAHATRDPGVALEATEPRWLNRARFQDRVANTLVAGRCAIAGDAAHVWAPVGGHGMNAGLRGAHNLAWKLASVVRAEAPRTLLDTYDVEQRATAHAVIDNITRMKTEEPSGRWMTALLGAILPHALRWVDRFPPVEMLLSEFSMHHRGSPLSRDEAHAPPWRAGDRCPAFVHPQLSFHQWTLLAPPSDAPKLHALTQRYRAKIFVATEGAPSAHLVVVRPDGHVGLVTRSGNPHRVETYLDTFLTRA